MGIGSVVVAGGITCGVIAGCCFMRYLESWPPYTPPDMRKRKWINIQKVAHSILESLRGCCALPINYLFPKATVIMPPHPTVNPYPKGLKKADWPYELDWAWRESYSSSLQKITVEPKEMVTSLHVAAGGGNSFGIQRFIGLEAKVDAEDLRGQTPAYWAAYFGHAAALAQLKLYGADLNHADKRGKTPLRAAVKYDNRDAVDVLASFNVDLNKRDGRGLTPLHLAAYHLHTEIYHKLICYGADRALIDSTGRTPEQVFIQRWEEQYRHQWIFTRIFSSARPPKLDLKPYTLQKMIEAKKRT